ncbi:LOW QUALITY PROTEIN: pentatricopeptide repeat-containing protein At1g53600, mitochondrial-like [Nymphaea colorata]|uniref:LOW QUALITY PROTEIN: pentatricopeptide repeat-containing protein At1g53600, mitochondrial-like n=1 Tax=Nymphaea colorata TaxID=210225 RepID=UPI00129E4EC9|nr:LOW QUALITY PROTEIN: pentatricopeptide repeat-containing protein At1g53600, mitochondrial-like [Nymphaea colorata]
MDSLVATTPTFSCETQASSLSGDAATFPSTAAASHVSIDLTPSTRKQPFPDRTMKQSMKRRVTTSVLVFNSLITEHSRRGNLADAKAVFDGMPFRNVASWTAMLTACAENSEIENARKLFDTMPQRNLIAWNAMMSGYISNRRLGDAYQLFRCMPERNSVSWTVMITGLIRNGMFSEAKTLFDRMPGEKNLISLNAILTAYVNNGEMQSARQLFDAMDQRNVVSWSIMVYGYSSTGRIVEAQELFDEMPERNVVSWTTMIDGYLRKGMWKEALSMFSRMRRLAVMFNSTTLTVLCDLHANGGNKRWGIQVHALAFVVGFESDQILRNALIVMYSRNGMTSHASKVFDSMKNKSIAAWNSMIAAYGQLGWLDQAYNLFLKMPKRDLVSWTTMILGFSNVGYMRDAIWLLENMPDRDVIAWTTVISGFVQNGEFEHAFVWFIRMLREGLQPNEVTFSCLISASSGLALFSQGVQVHACALKNNFQSDYVVSNLLISMYSKCGSIADAYKIFRSTNSHDLESWNSMIYGFAQHGHGNNSLELFKTMQAVGKEPNHVTFLCLLTACAHAGLICEGWHYFYLMWSSYGIKPGPDHYACMVDLLGRAGLLEEAFTLISQMPFEPHAAVWGALLGASRTHANIRLAKAATHHLLRLEPQSATAYVVLSKMYSMSGRKRDEKKLRMIKRLKDIKKKPGYSWIVVNSEVHLFLAGGRSHPELSRISSLLRNISLMTGELAV